MLTALEALEAIGRRLHPPRIPSLLQQFGGTADPVRRGLEQSRAAGHAPATAAGRLEAAAGEVVSAFDALAKAARDPDSIIEAYRALRAATRANEALYPLAATVSEVSRYFIEPHLRDDPTTRARVESVGEPRAGTGIMHVENDREQRGGLSLYVPEYYDPDTAYPLIVALHGGSGHGADFLWTWLREARSYGAILVSPTSRERTWSLRNPERDGPGIEALVRLARDRWNIDPARILLTGMSDGGTFGYLIALRAGSPFTHFAPSSTSFHLGIVDDAARERLAHLRFYVMHGTLDWMFPVDMARIATRALARAGADVVYREIEGLSHTYPRDENSRIMQWFLGQ